jgi:hypothetical protein
MDSTLDLLRIKNALIAQQVEYVAFFPETRSQILAIVLKYILLMCIVAGLRDLYSSLFRSLQQWWHSSVESNDRKLWSYYQVDTVEERQGLENSSYCIPACAFRVDSYR